MIEAYKQYKSNNFLCLPTKMDKSPLLPKSWQGGFEEGYFAETYGIGVICGSKSGGLECLDFDNHFNDAKDILTEYISIPEVKDIYEKHKLPIEETVSGGYHLLFRCQYNDGNRKLAQRLNDKQRPEALIETRGEGGYFVASPTPGYVVRKHDIFDIATISSLERSVLIQSAISLNEHTVPLRTEFESSDRPGDIYNEEFSAISDMEDILRSDGWVHVEGYKWRRPGKTEGISATLGKVAPNVFYVFSSSASPFEPMRAYTPFQVLALIRYNGDFKEAAASLVLNKSEPEESIQVDELDKLLLRAKIDTTKTVEKPPTILSVREVGVSKIEDKRLLTLGNFSCIIGKAKSKKTFLISLMTAALISSDVSDKLISSMPANKRDILYFDTEQGEYDCHNVIRRIERMTGLIGRVKAYSLREFSPAERCKIIEYAFQKYGDKTCLCVIDGIADLANAINDEDEATRVSTMMLKLTKIYNCHITTVIHQNKNDNFATGHLGSSIMKKAELLISVTKTSDPRMVEVSCDLSRGISFESFGMYVDDGIPFIGTLDDIESTPKFNNNGEEGDYIPF